MVVCTSSRLYVFGSITNNICSAPFDGWEIGPNGHNAIEPNYDRITTNPYANSTDWNITLPYHNKYHRCNPFKETSTVDITGWIIDSNTLPEALYGSQVVLTDKYCYLLGGYNGGTTNKIYRANLNSDGTISNWIIDNQVIPEVLSLSQVVLTDKYCYLLGGDNGYFTNKIYRANLNSDGTISNWIIDTGQVVLTDKYCYLLGGYNGSYTNKIYRANLNSDGTISNWIIDTGNTLPEVLYHSQVVLTDKYCYLLGGFNVNDNSDYKIYRANLNTDGTISDWIIDSNVLSYGEYGSQVVHTKNRVWLIGGTGSYNVQYADIINGEIGTFIPGTNLPYSVSDHMVVCTKSRIYILGSYNAINIYSAPFDGWGIGEDLYNANETSYALDISNLGLTSVPESVFIKDIIPIDESSTNTSLVLEEEVKVGDTLNINGSHTYEVNDVVTVGSNFVIDISSLNLTETPTVVYNTASCIPIVNISVTDSEDVVDFNELDVESIDVNPTNSVISVKYSKIELIGTVGKMKIEADKTEVSKIVIELDEATV
jgi:hypothetical protein